MKILIVEDDDRLAELIRKTLARELFEAAVANNGTEGYEMASAEPFDVIVLDRMLPGMDGMTILRELRRQHIGTPVLMLTALGDLPDRVDGLRAGADDYLGKPFALEELTARVRALGRRSERLLVDEKIAIGSIEVDLTARQVVRNGSPIELTPKEFGLLETLLRHRGQVLSRDQLLRRVWGAATETSGNIVELYIHYLRKKLDPLGEDAESIVRTVRGFGYVIR